MHGYFRNFLEPRNLAVRAETANVKWLAAQRKKADQRLMEEKERAQALAAELAEQEFTIQVKAGEGDRLFGSVTTKDIAGLLAKQKYEVDRRKITLAEPIKKLGTYTVSIRLYQEVEGKIKLVVEKQTEG